MDNGSLARFSCMLGLHTPCNQYLKIRIFKKVELYFFILPAESLQVSIDLVVQQLVIEPGGVLGVVGEGEPVASHGGPASNLNILDLLYILLNQGR